MIILTATHWRCPSSATRPAPLAVPCPTLRKDVSFATFFLNNKHVSLKKRHYILAQFYNFELKDNGNLGPMFMCPVKKVCEAVFVQCLKVTLVLAIGYTVFSPRIF